MPRSWSLGELAADDEHRDQRPRRTDGPEERAQERPEGEKESLFKVGMNTITVHARKAKTAQPACNKSGPEYGVFAQISACVRLRHRVHAPGGGGDLDGCLPGNLHCPQRRPEPRFAGLGPFRGLHLEAEEDLREGLELGDHRQGPGIEDSRCLFGYW